MKMILIFIYLFSTVAYSADYRLTDFVKRNGGYGSDYKYMRASTTGYFALSSGTNGTCYYITPELQSAVVRTIAIISRAPDSITWDIDGNGKCINLASSGPANDNLAIIDINNYRNIRHLSPGRFTTYVALNDLNPISIKNFSFRGVAYTRYTVNKVIGELYDQSTTSDVFLCVVSKRDFMETMIKSLGFNVERKGILYHMWSDPSRMINGEPYCDYAYIEIALWRMID